MVKKTLTYLMIILMAFICAMNYQLFVFPNSFAPAGLNGICTMIQHLFDFSIGYLNLLINIPLAVAVFFLVSKPQALRSMAYTLAFSVFTLILERMDLSSFAYDTANGTSTVLGPVVAGIITGFASGLIGVGTTWLLCIPINAIIYALTNIAGLEAYLPWEVAAILVGISVVLTSFAGVIPARSAAKKDPVVALRTE
jgi:hypothetical protein